MRTFTGIFCGLVLSTLILSGCGGGSSSNINSDDSDSSDSSNGSDNTVQSTQVPTIVAETSFDDSTLQGWSVDGLWHITDTQASNGTYSVWYADPNTANFDTGNTNSGSLMSPSFTLGNNPTLSFDYQLLNECVATDENYICDYDALTVEISTDDGATFTPLAVLPQTVSGFNGFKVDLYGYSGETVRIRFFFDTYDDVDNDRVGALIDNIVVTDHLNLVADSFPLTLSDTLEGSYVLAAAEVPLHFNFPFQGKAYSSTSVDINGYLDFNGSAQESSPDPNAFMNGLPRIAYLWAHLSPQDGGSISYQRTASAIIFTLTNVNSSPGSPNDLVATLNDDGSIAVSYGTIHTTTALVGITPGGGVSDPGETDLSVNLEQLATGVIYENFTGGGTDNVDLSDTTLNFSN